MNGRKLSRKRSVLSSCGNSFTEICTVLHLVRIARGAVGRKIAKDFGEQLLGQETSMNTSSMTSDNTAMARVTQSNGISATHNHHGCRRTDGPDDARSGEPVGGRTGLMDAVKEALSSIGVADPQNANSGGATTSDAANSDATTDPTSSKGAAALQSFMQTLLAALHSQGAASDPNAPDAKTSVDTVSNRSRPHHGDLAADLQGLMQELNAPDSADPKLADLKTSFQNLLGALSGPANAGSSGSTGDTSLGKFLQAFAAHVPGYSTVGNVVDTTA
jgi:hypothetical protein